MLTCRGARGEHEMNNEQARAELQANDRKPTVSGQIEHVVSSELLAPH